MNFWSPLKIKKIKKFRKRDFLFIQQIFIEPHVLGTVLNDKDTAMNLTMEPTILHTLSRGHFGQKIQFHFQFHKGPVWASTECRGRFFVKLMNLKLHGCLLSWAPSKVLYVLLRDLGLIWMHRSLLGQRVTLYF